MEQQLGESVVAAPFDKNVVFQQLSIGDLDGEHRQLLVRAISSILSTELAETTYAQIIDGLPIADVAYDSHNPPYGAHPVDEAHGELCPGMIDKARGFCREFNRTLTFNSQTRLIEMIAVAVQQIAVILFELDTSLHKDDGIVDWAPPKSDEWYWGRHPSGPLPTLFHHSWYQDYDQYPRGVADIVGYWAEDRILGGVVLFDRRDPEVKPDADPNAVYFHWDWEEVTYRIYRLLPKQRQALLDFLLADDPPFLMSLPILGDQDNRDRVDPEDPIQQTGIYRDLWERKELPLDGQHDKRVARKGNEDILPMTTRTKPWSKLEPSQPAAVIGNSTRILTVKDADGL
ncbi:hypothetical protein N658DRAFT_563552 [Parathielavia hyrcaniae]|uniref:Uncharacterized protein n=1 Tax=Parathielavia hyrcaniae TaxID=113614 RepID=A0AAN6QC33_9PEZI|nr:hypothetical protein N658DRAFT_563552 [Parathielavia hyrcaniae]